MIWCSAIYTFLSFILVTNYINQLYTDVESSRSKNDPVNPNGFECKSPKNILETFIYVEMQKQNIAVSRSFAIV